MDHSIEYQGTAGAGGEVVTVTMTFESDQDGVYNQNIESIKFEGVEVMGLISDADYKDLELLGCQIIDEKIEDKAFDFGLL